MSNHPNSARESIHRKRYTFWVNRERETDQIVEELIISFKAQRLFTQSIRDGLTLVADLNDGNLDALFELYPWVKAEFLQYVQGIGVVELPSLQNSAELSHERQALEAQKRELEAQMARLEAQQAWLEAEAERLEQERAWQEKQAQEAQAQLEAERQRMEQERRERDEKLEEKLDRIEKFMIEQGKPINQTDTSFSSGLKPVMSSGGGGPKSLNTRKIAPPSFADEDDSDLLEVRKDTTSGAEANENFLRSLQSLMDYKT